MNTFTKLKNLRVAIITHEYSTGPAHALEQYLLRKTQGLLFIAHPFVFAKEKRSHMRMYDKHGQLGKESFFPLYVSVQFINLIKDFFMTFWWSIRFGPYDLYIGNDNINASVGIILQKIRWVKKTVFYTIDYIPNRFSNSLLNRIYHAIDRFAVNNVDIIWNLSSIMEQERAKVGLNAPFIRKKQIVVPVGTDSIVQPLPFNKITRYGLVHMGYLTQKQGVQTVIRAIPSIVKRLQDFHFDIIGGGPMEGQLQQMVHEMHMTKYVTFHGFIKNHTDVEALLVKNAAAVAPYVNNPDNPVRFTDSGKVKACLAVGLPIIITKVPDIWKIIVREKAGIAVSDTPQSIADATVQLLTNEKLLRASRLNAQKLGKKYTWNKIFAKALFATLQT